MQPPDDDDDGRGGEHHQDDDEHGGGWHSVMRRAHDAVATVVGVSCLLVVAPVASK